MYYDYINFGLIYTPKLKLLLKVMSILILFQNKVF